MIDEASTKLPVSAPDAVRLAEEAGFADGVYERLSSELTLNEVFFRKYSRPVHDWDWREWGAKRFGALARCRVLDLGCGAGEEATYLAKLGATVTAIDISPIGIRLTNDRASFNGVADRVNAVIMRCDPTAFADESFDLVHGFGILHHIGLRPGLLEVKRLLKGGGRGVFFEHMGNSDLIERFKLRDGHYTTDERPLRWREIMACAGDFSKFEARPFHVVSRLRRALGILGRPSIKVVDHVLLSLCPPLRHFASGVVIAVEK
jgi:SAM-dependent methyltransferase